MKRNCNFHRKRCWGGGVGVRCYDRYRNAVNGGVVTWLIVTSYLLASGACVVLQTRIFKQILLYSFFYETFVFPIAQFVIAWSIAVFSRGVFLCFPASETTTTTTTTTPTPMTISSTIGWLFCGAKPGWDEIKAGFHMAVLTTISDALSIMPQIVLPSMLVALISQFGLLVMMAVSFLLLGKRYNKMHALAAIIVFLGTMVEIMPDYQLEVSLSSSSSSSTPSNVSSMFGDDYFHERYARKCISNDSDGATTYHHQQQQAHMDIVLGKTNATDPFFSPFWWRGSGVAFAVSVLVMVVSLVPACWSYAILEKLRSSRPHPSSSDDVNQSKKNDAIQAATMVQLVTTCRCVISLVAFFVFFVFSKLIYSPPSGDVGSNNANKTYLYSGWQCVAALPSSSSTAAASDVSSSGYTYYWECSFWKSGIDCEGVAWLSITYLVLDLLQYYLHVLLVGKVGANIAWFYGMLRTGISDLGFSLPSIAGRTYSPSKYYDMLSFFIVGCGVALFSFLHKEEEKEEGAKTQTTRPRWQEEEEGEADSVLSLFVGLESTNRSVSSSSSSSSVELREDDKNDDREPKAHAD